MSRSWDETFKGWAEAISSTDEEKGQRARETIEEAIRSDPTLRSKAIHVQVTGSYRNNTNTRTSSDIDVAVVLRSTIFYELPADGSPTREMLGFTDSEYTFSPYRADVGAALRRHFDAKKGINDEVSVTSGDKAFDVHATSYRLDADVAPFMEHRRYTGKKTADGGWEYLIGVEMRSCSKPDQRIVNWPEQHHQEGEKKNEATARRFKRLVRILKRLRADMAQQGDAEQKTASGPARSFLLECLVYNVPNDHFNLQDGGYIEDVRSVLRWLLGATRSGADVSGLVEVSRLKPLFGPSSRWTREQVQAFLRAAWRRAFAAEALPW
jgi:hypothetical protein